jgi:hypothetical protein
MKPKNKGKITYLMCSPYVISSNSMGMLKRSIQQLLTITLLNFMHSISIFTTYPMMVCNSSANTASFFFKANDHPPIPLCGKYFGQYGTLTCC